MNKLAVSLVALLPAAAFAQSRVLDPSEPPAGVQPGPPPNPYAPPGTNSAIPGAPALPQATTGTGNTPPGATEAKPGEEEGIYLGSVGAASNQGQRWEGEVPEVHVVQKGDTLWDICAYYFGDSWKWPEVWGMNPAITNPHWIYPGDLVRLMLGHKPTEAPATQPGEPDQPPIAVEPTGPARSPSAVELRQIAFVSTEDMKVSSKVVGSTQEKAMLSLRDEVYLEYPEGHPPQVGQRYSVYAPTKEIKHPKTRAVIGHYVMVRGEIEILEVKKGKTAFGIIRQVNAHGVIERGDHVGTLKTQLQEVEPVAADRSLEGVIAGIIGSNDDLIGEWQVVFIDRGRDDGVKVGNRMLAVRRGDERPKTSEVTPAGHDDRRYPDHYLGTLVVVDVGKTTSMGLMTRTEKELLIGDHVLMRKP